MKYKFFALVLLLWLGLAGATEFSVYEANYPGVKDYNINIDEATLVIHPRGNFAEMNLYLTVSYDFQSWFFKNYTELEFLWGFSLPEEAIMHEFWIWFGDSIMEATVLDKWTAELLFSDVSTPVRNPGLLTQSAPKRDGTVDYELRVFPMMRNQPRRFKIQYLVPGRPSVEALRCWLPTTQLISEKTQAIDSLRVIYRYQDNSAQPAIIGTEAFKTQHYPQANAWDFTIPLRYDQYVELVYPSPIQDDFFLSTYQKDGENFYHLAVYPPEVPRIATPRNILVVVDFNRINTKDLDGEYLMLFLKETVLQALTPEDSLNLLVAYDDLAWGADHWVSCSETNMDTLFSRVMRRSFPAYSYFQPLVAAAARFVNQQVDSTDVFFLTNANAANLNTNDRDALASEVIGMFKPDTRLHFVDLENKSSMRRYYNWVANYRYGYYETQLQSFFGKMTYSTGGNLFFLRYHSLKTILNALFYEKISHFERVEVQMRFQNGYAHSTHLMALHEGYYPIHFPIMQVGKFDGGFPVDVKILGKIRMLQLEREFTITEADVVPGSDPLATSWYGDHIRSLVYFPYDPITINDIINLSMAQRILTPYSGFLVYYPDENHGFCLDCEDETILDPAGVEALDSLEYAADFELEAYPNPFNAQVTFNVRLPHREPAENYRLAIFNILGQQVKNYTLEPLNSRAKLTWNGRDQAGRLVSTGIYFAILQGPRVKKTLKVLFVQ